MALSSRQVAILFILPVIFAAYIQNQGSTELSAKTQQFYCTSNQIKNLAKFMVHVKKAAAFPTDHHTEIFDQKNINLTMQRFDFTCKTFTDVMAIKHQLQFALFNGSYYFMDKNGSQAKVADGEDHIDYIKNFTIILENLETLTSILQDIRKIITNKQCIKFSSIQYEKIYWSVSDRSRKSTSVLNTLQHVRWAKVNHYPLEWTNDANPLPVHSRCTQ